MPTLDARKVRLLAAECKNRLCQANISDRTIRSWNDGFDPELAVRDDNYRKLGDALAIITGNQWTAAALLADSDVEFEDFRRQLTAFLNGAPPPPKPPAENDPPRTDVVSSAGLEKAGPLLSHYCQAWRDVLARPEAHEAWSTAQLRLDRYVWPRLSWEKPARRAGAGGADDMERMPISGAGDEPARHMISELLKKRRVILYDDAGMGKTAFTHKCFELLLKPEHWPSWFAGASPLIVRLEGRWPREKRCSSNLDAPPGTVPPPLSIRAMLIDQMTRRLSMSLGSIADADSRSEMATNVQGEVDAALRAQRVVVFVDAFDQMTHEDREWVARLLGQAAEGADDPDPDVRGCAWFLTGRAYAIKPFEDRFPSQTLRLRLERLNDAEQDRYFADLAAHPLFQRQQVKPLDWICRPRKNLQEDLGLPLNLREIRTLIEDGLDGLTDDDATSAHQESAWDRRRIATTGELHALVARVLLERALRHVKERREASGAPSRSPGASHAWEWAVSVLEQIEVTHRGDIDAFNPECRSFRDRKTMEWYAAYYLMNHATPEDLFERIPGAGDRCARDFAFDNEWLSNCWHQVIMMPQDLVRDEPALRSLGLLFERPRADDREATRPCEHMWRAWERWLEPTVRSGRKLRGAEELIARFRAEIVSLCADGADAEAQERARSLQFDEQRDRPAERMRPARTRERPRFGLAMTNQSWRSMRGTEIMKTRETRSNARTSLKKAAKPTDMKTRGGYSICMAMCGSGAPTCSPSTSGPKKWRPTPS